ncbi:MAG: type II toxin-antitoxin system VapC family toxin [Rhodoferax sp.]|nr:type II toxin-antitoxin system VapC family toxin [Rhodoferax sp.]
MKFLLDTHLLLWAAGEPQRLSAKARALINDSENALFFSAASLWEITIKNSLGRVDFVVDARLLRRGLLDNQYAELAITSAHAVFVDKLPPLHKDPFDRILVAQASVEGITLLTADTRVSQYPGAIQIV